MDGYLVKALKALLIALLALLAFAGTAARASNTVYAPGQGAVNSLDVGIDVKASVRGRCGFSSVPGGSFHQADFDQTGFSKDFAIALNCSSASRVAVTSSKGGLATAASATGYASKADYNVTLNLVSDNGARVTASCAAATLAAAGSCASFGGTASTTSGLRLAGASTKANGSYLRVSAPAYSSSAAPLIAGSYSDTLTITVSVAP
jgi:hypothetical protein